MDWCASFLETYIWHSGYLSRNDLVMWHNGSDVSLPTRPNELVEMFGMNTKEFYRDNHQAKQIHKWQQAQNNTFALGYYDWDCDVCAHRILCSYCTFTRMDTVRDIITCWLVKRNPGHSWLLRFHSKWMIDAGGYWTSHNHTLRGWIASTHFMASHVQYGLHCQCQFNHKW